MGYIYAGDFFFCYDWDAYITVQNFKNNTYNNVDKRYLLNLGHTVYPALYKELVKSKSNLEYLTKDSMNCTFEEHRYDYENEEEMYDYSNPEYVLADKINKLKIEVDSAKFPSTCYSKRQVLNTIFHDKSK